MTEENLVSFPPLDFPCKIFSQALDHFQVSQRNCRVESEIKNGKSLSSAKKSVGKVWMLQQSFPFVYSTPNQLQKLAKDIYIGSKEKC